jgi:hypothetical protein
VTEINAMAVNHTIAVTRHIHFLDFIRFFTLRTPTTDRFPFVLALLMLTKRPFFVLDRGSLTADVGTSITATVLHAIVGFFVLFSKDTGKQRFSSFINAIASPIRGLK